MPGSFICRRTCCEFLPGQSKESLGLTGEEVFAISGVATAVAGNKQATVTAVDSKGTAKTFAVRVRIDTPVEADYFRNGGILQYVLRQLAGKSKKAAEKANA